MSNNYHEQSDHDLLCGLCARLDEREAQRAIERKAWEARFDNHGKRIGNLERFRNVVVGGAIVVGTGLTYFKEQIKALLGLGGTHP